MKIYLKSIAGNQATDISRQELYRAAWKKVDAKTSFIFHIFLAILLLIQNPYKVTGFKGLGM